MVSEANAAGTEPGGLVARGPEARQTHPRSPVARQHGGRQRRANQQAACWEEPGGGRVLGGAAKTYRVDWSEPEVGAAWALGPQRLF